MHAENKSQAEIEIAVFGYAGGRAHFLVKSVTDAYERADR
jgi:hypothetical protein